MDVTFLFLDESRSTHLDTASLTGVFVPADHYARVRDAVIRVSVEVQRPPVGVPPVPLELHGSAMLDDMDGVTEADRLLAFERLVEVINSEQLEVLSIVYSGVKDIQAHFDQLNMPPGDKLYHWTFDAMFDEIRLPKGGLVVPVFDGIPGQGDGGQHQPVDRSAYETFLAGAYTSHWYRVALPKPERYVPNFHNLVEPTFSDSAKSPLLQLADVVGYLLHVEDFVNTKRSEGFKREVACIAAKLDRVIVRRVPSSMTFLPKDGAAP